MTGLSDTGLQAAQERFKTLLLGHVSKEVLGEVFRAYLEETGSVAVPMLTGEETDALIRAWANYEPPGEITERARSGEVGMIRVAILTAFMHGFRSGTTYARIAGNLTAQEAQP